VSSGEASCRFVDFKRDGDRVRAEIVDRGVQAVELPRHLIERVIDERANRTERMILRNTCSAET